MSKKFKYKKKIQGGVINESSINQVVQNIKTKIEGEFLKTCVKCNTEYRDNDPDPYWCESCNAERKALAKEIDRKVGSTVGQSPTSGFQSLDAQGKELADGAKAWYFSSTPPQYKKNDLQK